MINLISDDFISLINLIHRQLNFLFGIYFIYKFIILFNSLKTQQQIQF